MHSKDLRERLILRTHMVAEGKIIVWIEGKHTSTRRSQSISARVTANLQSKISNIMRIDGTVCVKF